MEINLKAYECKVCGETFETPELRNKSLYNGTYLVASCPECRSSDLKEIEKKESITFRSIEASIKKYWDIDAAHKFQIILAGIIVLILTPFIIGIILLALKVVMYLVYFFYKFLIWGLF